MDEDDLLPRKAAPQVRNLEPMSLAELEAYIAELDHEIERVRADIAAKRRHMSGADALFRK